MMGATSRKLLVVAVLFAALATAVAWLWLLYRDGGRREYSFGSDVKL